MWSILKKIFKSNSPERTVDMYKKFYSETHTLYIGETGELSYTPIHGKCDVHKEGNLRFQQYYFFYDKEEWENTDYKELIFKDEKSGETSNRPILDVLNSVYFENNCVDVFIPSLINKIPKLQ